MADDELASLIEQALDLREAIARRRLEISSLGARRRAVVGDIARRLGPSETARRLGIARQTVHEILNPSVPRARKARMRAKAPRESI